jgi:hypothetical protein
MILQATESIAPISNATQTPWVGGQLPSPWASPDSLSKSAVGSDSFAQALEQARGALGSGLPQLADPSGVQAYVQPIETSGLSKKIGVSSIEEMGSRLSKADAQMFRSVENLNSLDPSSPNLQAELLSVSLLSTKASISTTLAMKFSSKISENVNTLLKTN